ncbi:MAG TPA: DUF4434 domain-containing protein [Jiangellaceae bacterium]
MGLLVIIAVAAGLATPASSAAKVWREFPAPPGGHTSAMSCSTEPRLTGSFLQPWLVDGWTPEQWDAELQHLREACIFEVVLQWTVDSGANTAIYQSDIVAAGRTESDDVLARALAAAERAGVDVYVGLQVNDEWWRTYANDRTWLSAESELAQRLIDEIWTRYGAARSFAGWYLPFEVDNWHFGGPDAWDALASFYAAVGRRAKRATPNLPIVISPFFNPDGGLTPAEWAKMWATILPAAPIDAIALQDGIGAGHASADQLVPWFAATAAAIKTAGTATELWATTETFTSDFGPMDIAAVVEDMIAVQPYVSRYWSFSYDHYQSPQQVDPAVHRTYLDYLTSGSV